MNDVKISAASVGPSDLVSDTASVNICWLLFRTLGLIYLAAFISFWSQSIGLIGEDGIVPLVSSMRQLSSNPTVGQLPGLLDYPTIFRWIGSSDSAIHMVCFLGTVLSGLLVVNIAPRRCIASLWILYLSLFTVTRPFLGYQWDILLLESSVLIILFTPRTGDKTTALQRTTATLSLWLIRLALFKVILSSGLVKLNSLDSTWQNLTALDFHFWTQPIPHQLSWSIHHLGEQIRHVGVWFNHFVELAVPWLILCSLSKRMTIIWLLVIGTILMLYVGEYSIPMVLIIGAITLVLWVIERMLQTSTDDASWGRRMAGAAIAALMILVGSSGNYGFFNLLILAMVLICFTDGDLAWMKISRWRKILPQNGAPTQRLWLATVFVSTVFFMPINGLRVADLMGQDTLTNTTADNSHDLQANLAPTPLTKVLLSQYSEHLGALALVNGYGLFARMTTKRYELNVEGSLNGRDWLPYRFKYKPDGIQDLHYAGLHMPRLDWQMWFAALYPRCSRKWIFYFMDALFAGSKSVSGLLETNPFEETPPVYLRIQKVRVEFADLQMHTSTGAYWQRLDPPESYCPVIQRSNLEKANLTRRAEP